MTLLPPDHSGSNAQGEHPPPRDALGATQHLPTEERQLEQHPVMKDALAVRLGGRASEQVVLGIPSTDAPDDLVSATELASPMVRK